MPAQTNNGAHIRTHIQTASIRTASSRSESLSIALFSAALAALSATAARAAITTADLFTLGHPDGFIFASPDGYRVAAGGQVIGSATDTSMGGGEHAILWSAASPNGLNLHPALYEFGSKLLGTTGAQQVGYGITADNAYHALIWNGTVVGVVDLNPAGFDESVAYAAVPGQQSGSGSSNGSMPHAMIWSGTAASHVDMHPAGFTSSYAAGTDGSTQAGFAFNVDVDFRSHAFVWHGSAASAVDLHPAGFLDSRAVAAGGDQQVGSGTPDPSTPAGSSGGIEHALLWTSSAASAIDLSPTLDIARATDTNGVIQVGYTFTPTGPHALLWFGTAASVVDLQSFLPADWTTSEAYSIAGNTIYGIATDADNLTHAVTWTIPEPTTLYQTHRWDYDTPIEETLEALHDVVKAGKARYIGASSMYAWQFCKALHLADQHGWTRFVSMQNHYNLIYREEEREMMQLCQAEGVGVIPWSPLARGRLTRPWSEKSATERAGTDEFGKTLYLKTEDADKQVVDRVEQIAKARGVPQAQVALAWMLGKPFITAPIIGATKTQHLEDAVAALSLTLTGKEVAQLESPYVPHPVLGFS